MPEPVSRNAAADLDGTPQSRRSERVLGLTTRARVLTSPGVRCASTAIVQAGAALGLLIGVAPAASGADGSDEARGGREGMSLAVSVLTPARLTLPSPPLWRASGAGLGGCLQPDAWDATRARFEALTWASAALSGSPRLLELDKGAADEVFKRAPYLGTELQITSAEPSAHPEPPPSPPDQREGLSVAEGRSPTASGVRF
jgi:hypothetical protein